MKGTLTPEERDRLIYLANRQDEEHAGRRWWLSRLRPEQRKLLLRTAVREVLYGAA